MKRLRARGVGRKLGVQSRVGKLLVPGVELGEADLHNNRHMFAK